MVDQPVSPIESAEHHIAIGRQYAEIRRRIFHNGHVKRSATQVVDQDRFFNVLQFGAPEFAFHPGVGQRGGRRLVDDVDHIQPRDAA